MEFVIEEAAFVCLPVDFAHELALARDDTRDELPSEHIAVGLRCRSLPVRLAIDPGTVICLTVGPCTPALPVRLVVEPLANVTPTIWPLARALPIPLSVDPGSIVALPRKFQEEASSVRFVVERFAGVDAAIRELHAHGRVVNLNFLLCLDSRLSQLRLLLLAHRR